MRRDWAIRSSLSPLPASVPQAVEIHDAERARGAVDRDELEVAGVQAEIALRHVAPLPVHEDVPRIDDVQGLRDQGHQAVIVEMIGMKEDLMAAEQRADLLLRVDHDLVVGDRVGARGSALEILVRSRPDLLQAEEIGVPVRIEEGQQLLRPPRDRPRC